MGTIFFGVLMVAVGLFVMPASHYLGNDRLFLPGVLFICMGAYFVYDGYKKGKRKKNGSQEEKYQVRILLSHAFGLDFPQNSACSLTLYGNKVTFERKNVTYTLLKENVTDIFIKTGEELKKEVPSITEADNLLYPLYELLGDDKQGKNKSFLILIYSQEGKEEFVAFDVTKQENIAKGLAACFFMEGTGEKS